MSWYKLICKCWVYSCGKINWINGSTTEIWVNQNSVFHLKGFLKRQFMNYGKKCYKKISTFQTMPKKQSWIKIPKFSFLWQNLILTICLRIVGFLISIPLRANARNCTQLCRIARNCSRIARNFAEFTGLEIARN